MMVYDEDDCDKGNATMSGNPYLTLIRCVTALYLANRTPGSWEELYKTIQATLTHTELPTTLIGDEGDGMVAINLRTTVEWMLEVKSTIELDRKDLIQRVRLNLRDISCYVQELENAIPEEIGEEIARRRIRAILSELKYDLNLVNIRKLISKVNHRINYSKDAVDYGTTLREFQDSLSKYTTSTGDGEKTGFVGRLSTEDLGDVEDTFHKAKEVNSTEGVLKTGLVGMNRACGVGGFRRGELINFGALTHHYKTGMLNDVARSVPLHNVPWMWDEKKKPAVVRISFENKLEQDLPIIYRSLIEQDTGEQIDITEVDPVKASRYIKDRLESKGYTFFMECYDPNNFTVYDLLDVIMGYEAKGYEIHTLVVDYLELIARGSADRKDELINEVFQVVRNHCFPRGITVATGHQLSTEAQQIWREGASNFTQRVSNGGYYRNTKSLATKLDLEFVMCLIRNGEDTYLSVARGKHRGGERTPAKHLNFAYKFEKVGGLVDDVDLDTPKVIYDLNAVLNNNSDNAGFMDMGSNDDAW
jgi:hypothetical protein